MSMTTATTLDVAQVLAGIISDSVADLRVVWWISDASRPPVAVIAQPDIDYVDVETPFCFASWEFPVSIVVERSNDRDAQTKLSQYVSAVALALHDAEPEGVFDITPLSARPRVLNVAGTDLPAYELRVRVRA